MVWLDREPLRPSGRYLLQHGTRRTPCRVSAVRSRVDIQTLKDARMSGVVGTNDVVAVELSPQSPLYVDPYEAVRTTGSFILIDESTNQTVAAGLVR